MAAMRKKLDMDEVLTKHDITGKKYWEWNHDDFKYFDNFFPFTIAKPVIIVCPENQSSF